MRRCLGGRTRHALHGTDGTDISDEHARHISHSSDRLLRFASALRELGTHRDVDQLLQLAVDLSAELIPGCDVADVMLARDGHTTVPVATDPVSQELARAQQESGGGPCLAVLGDEEVVLANEVADDDRWPAFGQEARRIGVRSVLAYRLFVHRNHVDQLGALNLYSRDRVFDPAAVDLGGVLAASCSSTLLAAIRHEGLQSALATRDVIGQAKGVLMGRHNLTAKQAYDLLRRYSQDHNVAVVDLAEAVAARGDLPDT